MLTLFFLTFDQVLLMEFWGFLVFFLGGEVKRPGSVGHVPLPIQKPGMAVDENQLVHLPEPLLGRDRVHHLHQHQRQVSAPTRAQSRITHNWGASASPPHELPNNLHNPGEVPKSLQLPFPAGCCARHWRTTKCRNCDAFWLSRCVAFNKLPKFSSSSA